MAKQSDYGVEILVTNSDGVTFDLNKDYSKAIDEAKAAGQDTSQLEAQREAKTNSSAYGGAHRTGANQSSSYGDTYDPGNTATVRTSNSDALTTSTGQSIDLSTGLYAQNAKAAPVVGVSSVYDKQYMSADDVARIEQLSQLAKEARASGTPNPSYHAEAESIRAKYGYSGGDMGDQYIPLQKPIPEIPKVQSAFDTSALKGYLDEWLSAAQKQQTGQIDYATQQAIAELMRTKADAEANFQEQRDQIAVDEAKAKDNQALYAERRGDRGGIGAAQYDSIMNTAAQNRLAVNQAQTKLATDVARQISDLRAQGEFEKADALLSLSQQYLSQLIQLEQWAAEYNLSVAQFNAQLQQWQAEFELAVSDVTGYYQGAPTIGYQQAQQSQLASAGETLLAAGIMPSSSQLAAMGITSEQAQSVITAQKLAAVKPGAGGAMDLDVAKEMAEEGVFTPESIAAFKAAGYNEEYLKSYYGYEPDANPDSGSVPTGSYGTKYSQIWSRARTMFDNNATADEIKKFLDKYSDTELTDAGLDYILRSLNLYGYRGV